MIDTELLELSMHYYFFRVNPQYATAMGIFFMELRNHSLQLSSVYSSSKRNKAPEESFLVDLAR
jgi:hypothetical protein